MKLSDITIKLTYLLKRKVGYSDIAQALDVSRQYVHQIKDKDLNPEQILKINKFFDTNICIEYEEEDTADDCVSIPVLGEVSASMGYGVTVYNERQTASYPISRQLIKDLGVTSNNTEIIFAQGDSMMPTIESGDSLLVDHSRKDIYDGKIYCVRIEGQLYAKRLQKIPPSTIVVASDNLKYRSFEIDMSKNCDFDFAIIGEVLWWGRVAR